MSVVTYVALSNAFYFFEIVPTVAFLVSSIINQTHLRYICVYHYTIKMIIIFAAPGF